ncbi:dapper homolog 1 [Spea bombifrons]|uniref:dapper homolog 1 n=1 Tax=Spea bombifrons TaxID=233779 RepID=UPI002349E932|nr:dapper homolog 1 [Spea bombifrons]
MKPVPANCDHTGQPLEISPRRKEKVEADSERQRTRERLEATLAGLGELSHLRHRHELLVKAALCPEVTPARTDNPRSLEEKFLEENILLLKKQLNCLRKRDAGLLSQLHELDKQINDLKIDTEKPIEEHHETDSRPSSGFYELSDGTSGSLSNSSNSVFSECLSSCQSSTCFCSPLEASLNLTDGQPKSADDFMEWLDYREGQPEATGTIRRSFSTPHSNTVEAVTDVNPKYQCDLVSKNGNDVYRYPSPLHAVAVQSPMFLLSMMGNMKEEQDTELNISDGCINSELESVNPEGTLHQHANMCSAALLPSKKLDGYILSVIQKKSHPVRTNKPRTSVNADPAKGILRHGSICVKQTAAVPHGGISNPKNSKQTCLHSAGITSLDNGTCPPLKQCSKESQSEQLESKRIPSVPVYPQSTMNELQSKSSFRNNVKPLCQGLGRSPLPVPSNILKEISSVPDAPLSPLNNTTVPLYNGSHKEGPHNNILVPQETKIVPPPKRISPKNTVSSCHSSSHDERPSLDFKSEGSSSQSLDEGLLVNAHYIPAQQQGVKLHKTTKNVKIVKSSTLKHRSNVCHVLENGSQTLKEKGKVTGKKCRFPDDLDTNKKVRKVSPRGKKPLHAPAESGGASKNSGTARSGNKPHGQSKDVVLTKPRHKRGDYRRWKSSAEISYEEALRRARRRQQRELMGVYTQVPLPYGSPYAYIASDSEYSAECESLFHSTVVDTSEDEQSNYTTNCFGDSESSLSEVEFVGESTTSSDTDESGGLIWSQFVNTLPIQTATAADLQTTAKAFVKIKASHNLKKKILRFRSGSLKLMTTV